MKIEIKEFNDFNEVKKFFSKNSFLLKEDLTIFVKNFDSGFVYNDQYKIWSSNDDLSIKNFYDTDNDAKKIEYMIIEFIEKGDFIDVLDDESGDGFFLVRIDRNRFIFNVWRNEDIRFYTLSSTDNEKIVRDIHFILNSMFYLEELEKLMSEEANKEIIDFINYKS